MYSKQKKLIENMMEIKQYENYFNFSLYQCIILIFIGNIIKD